MSKAKVLRCPKASMKPLQTSDWLSENVANLSTRIYELVPLLPNVYGYRDASGCMCSGVVLPGPTAIPWILPPQPSAARPFPNPNGDHPIV